MTVLPRIVTIQCRYSRLLFHWTTAFPLATDIIIILHLLNFQVADQSWLLLLWNLNIDLFYNPFSHNWSLTSMSYWKYRQQLSNELERNKKYVSLKELSHMIFYLWLVHLRNRPNHRINTLRPFSWLPMYLRIDYANLYYPLTRTLSTGA